MKHFSQKVMFRCHGKNCPLGKIVSREKMSQKNDRMARCREKDVPSPSLPPISLPLYTVGNKSDRGGTLFPGSGDPFYPDDISRGHSFWGYTITHGTGSLAMIRPATFRGSDAPWYSTYTPEKTSSILTLACGNTSPLTH